MDDVFTLTRSVDESGSRVVRVLAAKLPVRLRSKFLWAHLHWAHQSILCAGAECPACLQGYTRRRYAFVAVDKPGLAQGVLQLTEHDVCLLAKLAKCEPESTMIGLQFRVWRSKSRQPLEAEFLGFTEELFAIPTESLMVDVLRIHGVRATEGDVRTGSFRSLIVGRTQELIGNARVTA